MAGGWALRLGYVAAEDLVQQDMHSMDRGNAFHRGNGGGYIDLNRDRGVARNEISGPAPSGVYRHQGTYYRSLKNAHQT